MKPLKKENNTKSSFVLLTCMLLIFPFITRFSRYDSGLSSYSWAPADGAAIDFYVYYKSRFFLFLSLFAVVVLAWKFFLQREKLRCFKAIKLLLPWLLLLLVSTCCSVSPELSIKGATNHFESVFIWFSYVIWFLYVYQSVRTEEDYKRVRQFLSLSVPCLLLVGILQLTGKGLLGTEWLKRFAMSVEDYQSFGSLLASSIRTKALPLTFDNPNYAGVYLAMLASFFLTLVLCPPKEEKKKERIFSLLCLIAVVFLLINTNSRTALVGVAGAMVFLFWFQKPTRKQWLGIVFFALTILCVDGIRGFEYGSRLVGTVETMLHSIEEKNHSERSENRGGLTSIHTEKQGVAIEYGGQEIFLSIAGEELIFQNQKGEEGEDIGKLYTAETGILNLEGLETVRFFLKEPDSFVMWEEERELEWRFRKTEEGYFFLNEFSKMEELNQIPAWGFQGFERIGSGRGYIWSRTLPLLSSYWLTGSGPDTFLLVFPQQDRVGKAVYCRERYTIIEKPHSMYLQIAVQNGIPALIVFLLFCGGCFVESFCCLKREKEQREKEGIALAALVASICYLLCGFFVDSAVQISPLFWTFLALAVSVAEQENIVR